MRSVGVVRGRGRVGEVVFVVLNDVGVYLTCTRDFGKRCVSR